MMPRFFVFGALLGVAFAAVQGGPGFASDMGCRVSLLQSSVGAASSGEPFTFERDVDGDGVADVVRLEKTIGTESSLIWGTLTLSASGEEIEISHSTSYYVMVNITVVPPALVGEDRLDARQLVEDALFGTTCHEPEPSLARLLSIDDTIIWREGLPSLPDNYAVYFPEAPVGLIPFIGAWSELGLDSDKPFAVWVEYPGGTHAPADDDLESNISLLDDGFEVLAATPRYRALGTRHGVVVIDIATERYAWIYVFKGGHKLRWKSIESAIIDGSEVTITARIIYPGAEQIGTVAIDLYDGSYLENWGQISPDGEGRRR